MEITINKNNYLRDLSAIQNLFGPPDSVANKMLENPKFFGKEFSLVAKIYGEYREIRTNTHRNDFWPYFLDRNLDIAKTKFDAIIKYLDDLDKMLERPDNESLDDVANSFVTDFTKHEKDINRWLKPIFDFKLPNKFDIIIDHGASDNSSYGSALAYNPFIISLQMSSYKNKAITIAVHELLHCLLNSTKIIPDDKDNFEEALLDYFAPRGILDRKLGIIDKLDIKERSERSKFNRPYASEESERLFKHIEDYYKICGNVTIWEFLKERGFEFINYQVSK